MGVRLRCAHHRLDAGSQLPALQDHTTVCLHKRPGPRAPQTLAPHMDTKQCHIPAQHEQTKVEHTNVCRRDEDQEVERHRRRTAPTHGHIALVRPTDDDGTGLEEAWKGGWGTLCLARIRQLWHMKLGIPIKSTGTKDTHPHSNAK